MAYNPHFIGDGIVVPEPTFDPTIAGSVFTNEHLREGIFADYIHYSIVMNRDTRQLIYAVSNIDQNKDIPFPHDTGWRIDTRVGEENQLDNPDYSNNVWDKGHMVMRDNNNWGDNEEEARLANNATYFYTNAAVQHQNLNRDEWKALETHIGKGWILDDNGKLCIVTGPVHFNTDRFFSQNFRPKVRIPGGFFKVVCFKSKTTKKLSVKAFMMLQDENTTVDQRGARLMKQRKFINQQVSLADITELTGIVFDQTLRDANPLKFKEQGNETEATDLNITSFPERIEVIKSSDLIDEGTARRTHIPVEERTVAIAAMMVNPEGSDAKGEWISIINLSDKTIDVTNWILEDDQNRRIVLSGKITSGNAKKIRMADHGSLKLRNTGGGVWLITDKNEVMDLFQYMKNDVHEGLAILQEFNKV